MIKLVTQHSYFNSTNRWVDFKTTHLLDGCIQNLHGHVHLAWVNKKFTCKPIILSIHPTFESPTPIPIHKVFPQCLCKTKPTNAK
jgi:hypothetical protein